MQRFLVEASYTSEGVKGLMKDGGSGRRAAVEAAVKGLGGKVEAMYFAFGASDVVVILDMPDNVAAVALAMAVNAPGTVRTRTTPLLTPEEMDQAAKKSVSYLAPGEAAGRRR